MTKTELIERIKRDARIKVGHGTRQLHANELRLVFDAINSVWPDEPVNVRDRGYAAW